MEEQALAGGTTTEEAVRRAYARVAEGYERALGVEGLPIAEINGLRACLRAAREIALQPPLSLSQ